ncbi:hypothetical protein [Mesoplasma seiffertii]|uniref:hypothetical protein n=1 Tax=Mesoplasma seiffertii TaxID=28224 RepID=UPI00047CAB7A|nr:hypothetical protein [Mesoplasma seiffertii]
MSKEKQANQELELGFFEPALGLIITNLEFLEDELQQEQQPVKELTKILDQFNELEAIEEFEKVVAELVNLTPVLEQTIFKIVDADQAKLLSYLYLANSIATNLKETALLMQIAGTIETKLEDGIFENNEENLVAEYKTLLTQFANHEYQEILNDLSTIQYQEEFKKVLNILSKEQDFDDLKEGNGVLMELFALANPVSNNSSYLTMWKRLNNLEGLFTVITFWEQDSFEDEE